MSSVLSSWFYILTLGIGLLLLIALAFIFFNPSLFLQLTTPKGELIDLTGVDDFNPGDSTSFGSAVIKIGANSYQIANSTTASLPFAFVQPGIFGIAAAEDVAAAKVTGTFFFWLLMLGIGFLTLLLAFIAVKYPEKLFGPQISALVSALPKTKSACSSSSSSCAVPIMPKLAPAPVPVITTPPSPPPAPKPPAATTKTTTTSTPSSGFTSAQLAVLQQIMAAMAASKPSTPTT